MMGAGGVAADERPYVSEVSPYVSDGVLVCDVRCGGLFSDRIVGTVQSGLPAVVEMIYRVETNDGKVIAAGVHAFELRYDVWEDVYSVAAGDSIESFAGGGGFDQMSAGIERRRRVPIVPESDLDPSREYAVSIAVAVHPLAGSEGRRVEGFVEESLGVHSHETWREQVLSINELVNRFLSRHKGASNRSDAFRTEYFTPGELPGSRFPVDGGGGGSFERVTVAMESGGP
jgi:hypothetical protein